MRDDTIYAAMNDANKNFKSVYQQLKVLRYMNYGIILYIVTHLLAHAL